MFKTFTLTSSLIATLILSGCGGESTAKEQATSVPQTQQINKPITTRTIEAGKSLILSANGVKDASYIEWYDENGKLLSTDKQMNRLFTQEGEYKIYLSVTDKNNQVSTDTIVVKVNRAQAPVQSTPNQAPIVKAKAQATDIMDLESIHLSDDGSYDPDGTIVKYEWRDMDGILLSDTKRLDRKMHYFPQYDFNHDGTTHYVKTLFVTDDKGAVSSKSFEIIVHKKPDTNHTPTVNAGADKTITEGESLTLTATANDSDGTITSYEWKEGSVVKGNNATLTLNNLSQGVHIYTVTVTDDKGATASDTVKVEVKAAAPTNHAPTANAQSITTNEDTSKTITLTGTDPDGDNLTYTITTQPTHGTLSGTAPNVTYTPNANYNGSDSFKFKVNDGKVESAVAVIAIKVHKCNYLPKTGQNISYANYDDGYYQKGADADPRFVRDNAKEIVLDKVTGLEWQDNIEAKSIVLKYSPKSYCENLEFAGYSDWRLPNVEELSYIVDRAEYYPSINPVFYYQAIQYYWTSTEVYDGHGALNIAFHRDGGVVGYGPYGQNGWVRCVRGENKIKHEFVRDDKNKTVIDKNNCLMWQDDEDSQVIKKSWDDAIDYCENLNMAGYSDWYLPNANELISLIDMDHNASYNKAFKNMVVDEYYWTSTTIGANDAFKDNSLNAYVVGFHDYDGYKIQIRSKKKDTNDIYVRCVRKKSE